MRTDSRKPLKLLYLDPFSGISGDMFLGALLDLGGSLASLQSLPERIGLRGVTVEAEPVTRSGLRGVKVKISTEQDPDHRHLTTILNLIESAGLPHQVQENASAIFRRIGEVEARLHDIPLERVHFHEIGAADSIMDIVGCCLLLHELGFEQFRSSPPAVGYGTAKMAHGEMPLPAPATLRLLEGVPVRSEAQRELTTPTGAALLRHFVTQFGPLPEGVVLASGYGAGKANPTDRANLLRLTAYEAREAENSLPDSRELLLIETTIDDLNPEIMGGLLEKLYEHGALEAILIPVIAKKSRPGVMLRVLAEPDDNTAQTAEKLERIIFRETGTLGLRKIPVIRRHLDRRTETIQTEWGPLLVKVGLLDGEEITRAPEYEDCKRLSKASGLPLKEFYRLAAASGREPGKN